MRFIYYTTASGECPLLKYLRNKSQDFTRSFHKKIRQIQDHPELMSCKHLRDGIYELRIWPLGQVCRPLYAAIAEGDYLILHMIDHLDGKAEFRAIETALERLDEWNLRNP